MAEENASKAPPSAPPRPPTTAPRMPPLPPPRRANETMDDLLDDFIQHAAKTHSSVESLRWDLSRPPVEEKIVEIMDVVEVLPEEAAIKAKEEAEAKAREAEEAGGRVGVVRSG